MIEEVIVAALGPLVGGRVYPVAFPQEDGAPTWPAIRYTIVSEDPQADLCGTDDGDTDDVRVQIDYVATTYAAARALRQSGRAALMATDPPNVREPAGYRDYDQKTKTFGMTDEHLFQPSTAAG